MIGLAIILATTQARMSLACYQRTFYINDGAWVLPVLANRAKEPIDHLRFRRGETFAVWDKRGLSLRSGHWIFDTRFQELAVSPKLFSKPQIKAILESVQKGNRSLEATSMSGAMRLGGDAYFLPRWIDRKGNTWLEALVRVDLTSTHPKPILVGRFAGTSLASGSIDNRLFPLREQPAVIVRKGSQWGLATYDPIAQLFDYSQIGERLKAYADLEGHGVAFIEAEDGGLSKIGLADLATASRRDLLEDRGNIRLLDGYRPLLALVDDGGRLVIRNLETAAAKDLPADSDAQRTPFGVLVSWPKEAPKHAVVIDANRWEDLASWAGDSQIAATANSETSGSKSTVKVTRHSAVDQARSPGAKPAAKAPRRRTGHHRASSRSQPQP